jgi:hypothetical protein
VDEITASVAVPATASSTEYAATTARREVSATRSAQVAT